MGCIRILRGYGVWFKVVMGDGSEGWWVRENGAHFILHGNRQPEATLGEWTHSSLTITIQCACESMYVHV